MDNKVDGSRAMVKSTVDVVVRVKPRQSHLDDAVTVVDNIEVSMTLATIPCGFAFER